MVAKIATSSISAPLNGIVATVTFAPLRLFAHFPEFWGQAAEWGSVSSTVPGSLRRLLARSRQNIFLAASQAILTLAARDLHNFMFLADRRRRSQSPAIHHAACDLLGEYARQPFSTFFRRSAWQGPVAILQAVGIKTQSFHAITAALVHPVLHSFQILLLWPDNATRAADSEPSNCFSS